MKEEKFYFYVAFENEVNPDNGYPLSEWFIEYGFSKSLAQEKLEEKLKKRKFKIIK